MSKLFRTVLVVGASVTLGGAPMLSITPAHAATPAAVPAAVVAGPVSFAAGYYTPTTVVAQGGSLTFLNADLPPHNVVAVAFGPDTPLCASAGYSTGQCPVFFSRTIGPAQSSAVNGVELLSPGSYAFYCTIHPKAMNGTLIVN